MPSFVHFMSAESLRAPVVPLPHILMRRLSGFVLPVLIFAAAHFAAPLVTELPRSLAGLRTWGPLKAAESDADTSCLRRCFDLRGPDG